MHLKITSKPFSLSEKKKIFLNGENLYNTQTENLAGKHSIKLIELKSGFVKSIIVREIALLQDSFTIRFLSDGNVPINFSRIEKWKHNYEGVYKENKYCIKEFGNGYKILKNNVEIGGWINQYSLSFIEEDNFNFLNNEQDLELIICLCIIINQKESSKRDSV